MDKAILNMCNGVTLLKIGISSLLFTVIMSLAYWLIANYVLNKNVPKKDYLKIGMSAYCCYFTALFFIGCFINR